MTAQCDPGDCDPACACCEPTPALTPAQAIARIRAAVRGADEIKRRWQNGFLDEGAYTAAVDSAIAEIRRVLPKEGR